MPVAIDVEVKFTTDKALLVDVEGEEVWVPKSQVVWDESDVAEKGDKGTLTVTDWLAKERGLDD